MTRNGPALSRSELLNTYNMKFNKIGIKKIKKIFKRTSPKRHEYMNPVRDWSYGLVVAAVLFLSGVTMTAIDFYFQMKPKEPEATNTTSTNFAKQLDEVDEYAAEYNEKARQFNALRNSQVYVPPAEEVSIETENDSDEALAEEESDE